MNKVLDEISSIPGIVGGIVFCSIQGVRANNLPPVFKESALIRIGKVIDKMYTGSQSAILDITELSLYYEESTLIVRLIGETRYLIIFCEPSLNQNLLTMTLNMSTDELAEIGSETGPADVETGREQPNAGPSSKQVSVEDMKENSPMAGQLQGMETALFKIVGPMAKIIFKDAVNAWINAGHPSEATLPDLVTILASEINDSEKEDRYQEMIAPYLEDAGDER